MWLALGLSSATTAQLTFAKSAAKRAPPGAPTDALSGPLASEAAESSIRTLASSGRPAAPAELADFSLSPAVAARAQTLLASIRALARMVRHPAAQKALLHHLRTPSAGDQPPLRRLARATAALALAAGGQVDGVRALVLLAAGPDDSDPELATLARAALLAHPPDETLLGAALPWLDAEARAQKVAWISQERWARQQAQRARCEQAGRSLSQLAAADAAPELGARILSDLAACPPTALPTLDAWKQVGNSSALWALRGTAALGIGVHDAAWKKFATAKLADVDARVRSAAAWFLSTTSPEASARLALDPRTEVRAAARNQDSAGGPSSELAEVSPCAIGKAESSSKSVFSRFLTSTPEDSGPLLGCLASRLRAEPGAGFTAAELASLLESSPALTRVLVAKGLGESIPEAQQLGRGLAQRAYATEPDAYVRRFLCAALIDLGLTQDEPLAREMADLDPDPLCRALGQGREWEPLGSQTLSTVTTGKRYLAARVLAAPVAIEPAPDGFVGARVVEAATTRTYDPHFVDCSESGEPAWACGRAVVRPR